MNIGTGVGIAAGVIAGGAAGAFLMHEVVPGWGRHDWNRSYGKQEDALAHARQTPGASAYPFPSDGDNTSGEEFSPVIVAPVFALFAAGGAVAGGVKLLGMNRPILGIAALAGAGALVGGMVGGIMGYSKGAHAEDAEHPVNVASQAKVAFEAFDRNGDGVISLERGSDGSVAEYLRQTGREDETGNPVYDSAKDDLTAADANHDQRVTPQEIADAVARLDKNHDGSIVRREVYDRNDGLNRSRLLDAYGPKFTG